MFSNYPDELESATRTLENLVGRWGLILGDQIPGATCSLVYRVESWEGENLVLKVPVIGEERTSGYRAALAFAGRGGIAIRDHDAASGSLLMPELGSDRRFTEMSDREAAFEVISLITRLHKTGSFEACSASAWFRQDTPEDPGSPASEMIQYLLNTTIDAKVLHGDLHHFNILWDGFQWVALDPKGILADRHYEPVAFLRNPAPHLANHSGLRDVLSRRIALFSEGLGLDPWRIWAWAWADLSQSTASFERSFAECWSAVASALADIRLQFEAPAGAPKISV